MTTICLKENKDHYILQCKGHATGSEQVCAAISMMITSIANWARVSGYDGDQALDPGNAQVIIPKSIRGADTIFRLAKVSFGQLAEQEKEYVTLCRAECRGDCDML